MARLIVAAPDGTHEVSLDAECRIGRGPMNDLSLAHDPKISNPHARIFRDGAEYKIEDMSSRNGTYLERDGTVVRVTSPVSLKPTDVVRIVSTRLRLELSAPTAGEAKVVPPLPMPGGPETPATQLIGSTVKRDGLPPPPTNPPPDTNPEPTGLEEENRRLRAELDRLRRQVDAENKS